MIDYKLFKMSGVPSNEYYIVINDKYFFWDNSYDGGWWEGFYKTWQEKLRKDGEVISETSKLEILVLTGPKMIRNIEAFDGKGFTGRPGPQEDKQKLIKNFVIYLLGRTDYRSRVASSVREQ